MLIGGTKKDFRYGLEIGTDVMPAGGKRFRCDSSVQFESSPGRLAVSGPSLRDRNELPSPTTASPVGIQSSCACILNALESYWCARSTTWRRVSGSSDEVKSYVMNRVLRRSAINKADDCTHICLSNALLHESEGKSYIEVEIFAEVLGTKVGYVRGLGHSVRTSSGVERHMDCCKRFQNMGESKHKGNKRLKNGLERGIHGRVVVVALVVPSQPVSRRLQLLDELEASNKERGGEEDELLNGRFRSLDEL
ncbi:hypothetical protein CJ030_MR8G024954 [Morella rubra]|uniref:Uncharacterized protein n=1 Tax=Morella rubra TaxID=262757 RepID=A0A6A1URG6_9ROSI|nr:hypothetical protein CJ030_MR8G024954 [Morella rubra]